ncbi:MAG: DUF3515 domain-containing protein [Nocardioidaceae bacterium]
MVTLKRRPTRLVALFAWAALLLTACGGRGEVQVTPTEPAGVARQQCTRLVAHAPSSVDGQQRRSITPHDALAGAWGDPPIVLRCGVQRPAALRPTSQCFAINGVGWLVTQDGKEVDPARPVTGTLVFTTIGRAAYVQVTVPDNYQPATDVLVDLTNVIKASTKTVRRCA